MRFYSIIIPVYDRPDELDELLSSLSGQTYIHFEVIVVEDGSTITSRGIVKQFSDKLDVHYYRIENSGPGLARNYGVGKARGEYVLILDSDTLLPSSWLEHVHDSLRHYPVDAFGGPDRAHESFSPIQKSINYAMTSFFTTGGIRGGREKMDTFYPRSFNMGVRREVYDYLGGFSSMRYGEDIDFSIRIMRGGYPTRLFPSAWVYHKRRADFIRFFRQVCHSGEARIILSHKYPGSLRLVHCLPAVFICVACLLLVCSFFSLIAIFPLLAYTSILFIDATIRNKGNLKIGFLSVIASLVQLFGYGWGFLSALTERRYFR